MKVNQATIKLILRASKVLSDGSHPIYLRVNFNGMKEVSTGCSCTSKYWDKKNESIKKGYPNYASINQLILQMKNDAIARRNEFELNHVQYTPAMVLKPKEVLAVANDDLQGLIDRYTANLSPTTCKAWKSFKNSFFEYVGKENMSIKELDLPTIKGYAKYLEDKGLKDGSILMFVSKLSALCKAAIEEGLISESPFKHWNFCRKYKADSNPLYVDKQCIEILKEMLLERLIIRTGENTYTYNDDGLKDFLDRRSDLFVLAFYLFGYTAFGLAPIDLCQLRIEDMKVEEVKGVNYYTWSTKRQKTGVPVRVMISQDKFFDNVIFKTMLMFRSGYLLPVLDGVENDHLKIYKKVSNWLSNHSDVLEEWFKKANKRIINRNVENNTSIPLIDLGCTFYSYRSSFAMAFMQNGGNLLQLCTMLGRGINASLKSYVKQLKQSQDIADAVTLL